MDQPGGGARAPRGEPRASRWSRVLTGVIGRADRAEEGVPAGVSILAVRAAEWQALGAAADDPQSRSSGVLASLDAMARADAVAPVAPRRPNRLDSIMREAPPREETVED